MATDEELIAAVASGDGRGLEELCGRWERPLYQLSARHTGGRDVEDLYQETWLRVVRAARRFERGRRFSTWLFQIAVNLCRDWRRRPPLEPVDPAAADARAGAPAATDAALDARRLLAPLPAAPVPAPPLGLTWRLLAAAEPLLARNARRAAWPTFALALAAALLPLPAILLLDFYLVRAAFALLTAILPTALGAYLTFNYAATLALLLALTYAAIPIFVEHQVRLRRQESHA